MLTLTMAAAITSGQVYFPEGYEVPSYAFINVAPNPVGVGQTVTINFFLATPLETSEFPINMYVERTDPDGTKTTLGPFTGDTTGGSYTTFVPTETGEYTFKFIYEGQTLVGRLGRPPGPWAGLVTLPSESDPVTLTVQEEPIIETAYPTTPLPTQWWQTPVSSQNVENWYKIMGSWLGYGSISFAQTGQYDNIGMWNPYTESVLSGHLIWTKPWHAGGIIGGEAGPGQDAGHYWSTRQYQPQYAPVIMNGIMYSTWYPETTRFSQGILATDLFTGETLWRINTTNPLQCGMEMRYYAVNQYGGVGPFIWTTGTLPAADTGGVEIANRGTQWNMYSAWTGQYFLSIVNGTRPSFMTDESGNMIGYYINSTAGTETVHPAPGVDEEVTSTGPHMTCFNMTMAIGQTGGSWQPSLNTVRDFSDGIMWTKPVPTEISGESISPRLSLNAVWNEALIMTGGYIHGQGVGGEVPGWLVVASMDPETGSVFWVKNLSYPTVSSLLPFTRTSSSYGDGLVAIANDVNKKVVAFDVRTGNIAWETTLNTPYGDGRPNDYDLFSLKSWVANGVMYWHGLGGDIWAVETKDGSIRWYTNTTTLMGDPGTETPYGIWPLWVFDCNCQTNDVGYFAVGHEYNPPLFHGAQLLAINATNGELIWKELGTYIRSTAIAYGVMLSLNAYDNQIYAFAKGPSATTVMAPDVGVTTETPITIKGTVMDVSPGTKQSEVALNFPNGLPCVSDESQSAWMEYVYQNQPCPGDASGVKVTLSVIDSNGNYRQIGSTTTNAAGTYGFTWTPDIPGQFNVIASFEGSNSYYASSDQTYFYASEAPQPTPAPTPQPASAADLYFLPMSIVTIILIVIVGAMMFLMLRKR